jgi:hypothetical protein
MSTAVITTTSAVQRSVSSIIAAFSDYEEHVGAMFATRSSVDVSRRVRVVSRIVPVEFNVKVDYSIFENR